jgi:hypothetical protein
MLPWWRQLGVQFRRVLVQQQSGLRRTIRADGDNLHELLLSSQASDLYLLVLSSCFMGWAYGPRSTPGEAPNHLLLSLLFFGSLTFVESARSFAGNGGGGSGGSGNSQRALFWREASTGVSTLAHFLAVALADMPKLVLRAILFVLPVYFISEQPAPLEAWILAIAATGWSASGYSYLISVVCDPSSVELVGVTTAIVLGAFFGGVMPSLTLRELQRDGGVLWVLSLTSFSRWAADCLVTTTANFSPSPTAGTDGASAASDGFGDMETQGADRMSTMVVCEAAATAAAQDFTTVLDRTGFGSYSNNSPCFECREPRTVYWWPLAMLLLQGILARCAAYFALDCCDRHMMSRPPCLVGQLLWWRQLPSNATTSSTTSSDALGHAGTGSTIASTTTSTATSTASTSSSTGTSTHPRLQRPKSRISIASSQNPLNALEAISVKTNE